MKKESKAYAVTSLVLGILGLILFLMPYFAIVFSILAIVFSRKQQDDNASKAGLVLGIIGTCLNAVMLLILMVALTLF